MKGGKEHRAPLSDRAVEILSVLPRIGNFVFRAAKSDRPISSSAMLELVRGMRGMGATVHGFRSSFRDWTAEQTAYPTELCEMALAHAVGNKVEAAYKRGDMMESAA
jgi:integrase